MGRILLSVILGVPFLLSCSEPEPGVNVGVGGARLTINGTDYPAVATLDQRLLGETWHQQIRLFAAEHEYMDMLNEDFHEGMVTWDDESFSAEGNLIFLTSRAHGGGGFGPTGGVLVIQTITDSTITGLFNLDMYNFASSCYRCEEDRLMVSGEFIALKRSG